MNNGANQNSRVTLSPMSEKIIANIIKGTINNCSAATKLEEIQVLWSGYGSISRWKLVGSEVNRLIVKDIRFAPQKNHPRAWNTNQSHQRKLKSYQVEANWYRDWAKQCDMECKVPLCYAIESDKSGIVLLLEDLDKKGFPRRKEALNRGEAQLCLKWLANFHATFLNKAPHQLWDTGCYWHLATRKEELDNMEASWLKEHAPLLDQKLSASNFQTIVHGDAKVANFCFSSNMDQVAAVDFQYVGKGCGMKDVAYFLGSCLSAEECENYEEELLAYYFKELEKALRKRRSAINFKALQLEWRQLYPIAWTDFTRFLKGWMPDHSKLNSYSEKMEQLAKDSLL